MYKKLVLLDKEKHKNLKVSELKDLNFAKQTSVIPLQLNEVSLVGANFPVVFTGDNNSSLVCLVSLGGKSLAINSKGKWAALYIPAYIRRYPFSMKVTEENSKEALLLIDESSSLFSKSKGKQLFRRNGKESEILENTINFLKKNYEQIMIAKKLVNIINDSGILEEGEICIGEGDEKKVLVNRFKVVNKEKLHALSDDVLAQWARKGIMTVIEAHLKSLENIHNLVNIEHEREG